VGAGLIFFVIAAIYLGNRVMASASVPTVHFIDMPSVVSSSPAVIRGTVGKNVKTLAINGQMVGLSGSVFEYELFVMPGLNLMTVSARTFWGKELQWEQPVVMASP
jgi:hypothetical protein